MLPAKAQLLDASADQIRNLAGMLDRAAGQQHAELIAAQVRKQIPFAQLPAHQPGDLADELIAGRMTARVVDHLELIEVEIQKRRITARAPLLLDRRGEPGFEFAAVAQPRERIVRRLILEAAHDALTGLRNRSEFEA